MATKKAATTSASEFVHLDPSVILADDNSRFALKGERIEALASDIIAKGGVMQPVEVEPIASSNGHHYRLTSGFYRHAAVVKLNKEQSAGLTIPARIHENPTGKERLLRQLAENMERENQSPMDQAIAMRKLLDAGMERQEVRVLFSRPGGRKGNKIQPASNAYLNMTLSFLDFPADIKRKIHSGEITVSGAYELSKAPADKWKAIIDRIENERERTIEADERDEKRLIESQAKAEKANAKVEAASKAAESAKTELEGVESKLEVATKELKELTTQTQEAYKQTLVGTKEERVAAKNAHKALDIKRADADKAVEQLKTLVDSLTKKQSKASELAASQAERLKAIRDGKKGKSRPVTQSEVKQAAKKEDVNTGASPLTSTEMRKVVEELALPGGNETVRAVGAALKECFEGKITSKALYKKLEGLCS